MSELYHPYRNVVNARLSKEWLVRLICCGHDDGAREFDTWEVANQFRNAYVGDGNMGALVARQGHKRAGIIFRSGANR